MPNKAEEFFGQSFNSPVPPPPQEEKGVISKAMTFFGIDFSSKKEGTRDTGVKPISKPLDGVFERLIQAESRGMHTDAQGRLTTSPVGAQGITQLMPATAKNPGFGIEPVKDQSEGEYRRVGRQYLEALVGEFGGDMEKAVAAYNAGARNVKMAVKRGGEDWKSFLPKKEESLPYLKRVLGTD